MPPRTDRAGLTPPADAPASVEEAEPASKDRRTGARRTLVRRTGSALMATMGRS